MKSRYLILSLLISSSLIFACKSESEKTEEEPIAKTAAETDSTGIENSNQQTYETQNEQIEEREPTDDELREFGIVSHIEDGIYPMFIVTMEFPEREMFADLNLNIESIPLDMKGLFDLEGKYATIYYLSNAENNLHDIQFNGKSLLGEYAPEIDPQWKEISGILKGAESETMSDLPDIISVVDNQGYSVEFEYYITPEMAEVNGKKVKVFYSSRYSNKITYILPSQN